MRTPEPTSSLLANCAWIFVLALVLIQPLPAQAYLDPASGSLFLQALLGGVAGGVLLIRLYWRKFLGVLRLDRSEGETEP